MRRCALGGKFEYPFAPMTTLAAKAPASAIVLQSMTGFRNKLMRIAVRLLAILILCALLAPEVRWAAVGTPVDSCTCPPNACMCPHHHHHLGQLPICCMGKGCGLDSPDGFLASLLSVSTYVPAEYHWSDPLQPMIGVHEGADLSLLPSHARIPEQPPRATH